MESKQNAGDVCLTLWMKKTIEAPPGPASPDVGAECTHSCRHTSEPETIVHSRNSVTEKDQCQDTIARITHWWVGWMWYHIILFSQKGNLKQEHGKRQRLCKKLYILFLSETETLSWVILVNTATWNVQGFSYENWPDLPNHKYNISLWASILGEVFSHIS